MQEKVYVIRGPKGRANQYVVGYFGEWGTSRKEAIRGPIEWAEQVAAQTGGVIDYAGMSEVKRLDWQPRELPRVKATQYQEFHNGWNW